MIKNICLLNLMNQNKKVVKVLQKKEINDKEKIYETNSYKEEILELKRRVKDCEIEAKQNQNEKDQIINSINKLKPQKDNEVNQYLDYILELGNMTGDLNNKIKGKKNIIDLLNFTKDTLSVLQQKETLINEYIIEIENNEENVNKKLINDISDRKKFNKREKLMQLKIKQEQNENNKRLKAIERAQRVIIKGRKVPQEYPILKGKKKQKDDNEGNEDDYYAMLYYSSDDD